MSLTMLEAVLPLTLRDLPRSRILAASLDRCFPELGTCWVVARGREVTQLRRSLGGRYQVIAESEVVPELRFYRRVRRVRGWFLQQLLKLAITPWIRTPFYLTLDADIICTKRTTISDLILNGRALSSRRYPSDLHAEWYRWAERVLGMKRSGLLHGVTPAILSTEAVTLLQQHLAERVHPLLKAIGHGGWRGYLLRNLPWTEYTLYFTFLEGRGLFDRYHVEGDDLCGESVWYPEQFAAWRLPENTHFAVVQSTAVDTPALEEWLARQGASPTMQSR